MALHSNFDTIAVRVHLGASGCIRVHFVLVFCSVTAEGGLSLTGA